MAEKEQNNQLISEISKSRKEKKRLNCAIQNLQDHIIKANKQNDVLSADLQNCKEKAIQLQEKNAQLTKNNKDILQELVNVKQALCTLQKDIINVKEDYIIIKKQNEQCNQELDSARNQISAKENDIRSLIDKYECELEELKSHQSMDDAFSTLTKENNDLNCELDETQNSLKLSLLNNKQLRDENYRLHQETRSLVQKNNHANEELQGIILASKEKDMEVFKLKEDLSAADSKLCEQNELLCQKSEEHSLILQKNERLSSRYQAIKAQFGLLNRSLTDSEKELQQLRDNYDILLNGNLEKLMIIVKLSEKIRKAE